MYLELEEVLISFKDDVAHEIYVVIRSCLISLFVAAFRTSVRQNILFFSLNINFYRFHEASAAFEPVPWNSFVHMQRIQAFPAMIAFICGNNGVFLSTMEAGKWCFSGDHTARLYHMI